MIYTGRFVTLPVLAGAYKAEKKERRYLTHSVKLMDDATNNDDWNWDFKDGKTLCGKIPLDHITDSNSDPDGVGKRPTCPICLPRDPRFVNDPST